MILGCPNCNTRFLVADHLLPPFGRTVKCGACKSEWHATPEDGIPEDSTPKTVDSANFESVPASAPAEPTANTEPAPQLANTEEDEANSGSAAPLEEEDFSAAFERAAAEQQAARQLPVVITPLIPTFMLQLAAPAIALVWLVVAAHVHFNSWQTMPVLSSVSAMFGGVPMDGIRFDDIQLTPQKQGQSTTYLLSGVLLNESAAPRTIPTVRVRLKDKQGNDVWSREYGLDKQMRAGESYPFRIDNVKTAFGSKVAKVEVDVGNPLQLMFR